jgi:predicted RNase H-like HicB family nuclease
MKFQIATYRRSAAVDKLFKDQLAGPYTAVCRPFPWSEEKSIWACGDTPEEARARLMVLLQNHVDWSYPELEVTEVELEISEEARARVAASLRGE